MVEQAVAAVAGAGAVFPESGCIALCGCALLASLDEAALLAALPTLLPPLTAVLHSPSLHPACTAQAAACLAALLGAARSSEDKPQLAADLAPRLLELLQWEGCPGVQLQASRGSGQPCSP